MAAYSLSLAIVVVGVVSAPAAAVPSKSLTASIVSVSRVQTGLVLSHNQWLSCTMDGKVTVGANLRHGRLYQMKAAITTDFALQAKTCTLGDGVTVRDAVNAIMALWGQSCGSDDSPMMGEAVGFLNAAMQRLHSGGKDFGFVSRVRRTYGFDLIYGDPPVTRIELESDVQHVEGNVVLSKPAEYSLAVEIYPAEDTPLRPLSSSEAVESVRQRYSNNRFSGQPNQFQNTNIVRPIGYFVRAETETAFPRPGLCIELAPAMSRSSSGDTLAVSILVDVHLHAPRYSCCDVRSGAKLPVPHRYAESLLIPLARYLALSARYRVQESTVAMVRQQAGEVRKLLGDVDPRDAEVQNNRTA